MGYQVTTLAGEELPPLATCDRYHLPGLLIAATPAIYQDLQAAIPGVRDRG
jgi:hypothetical protein